MNDLTVIDNARFPTTYEAARHALSECARVDECKAWDDKAAALASYARQSRDVRLENMAKRIRARALRRAGQLLKKLDGRKENAKKQSDGSGTLITQREAAEQAGMSKRQQVTSVRIANVPEDSFESQVESDRPPTLTDLARQAINSPPIVDIGVPETVLYVKDIEVMAGLIEDLNHEAILPELDENQIAKLRRAVSKIDAGTDKIASYF